MSDGFCELLGHSITMSTTSLELFVPGLDDTSSLGSASSYSLDSSSYLPLGDSVVALGSVQCIDSLPLKSNSVLLALDGFQKSSVVNGLHFLDKLSCSSSGSEHGINSLRTSPTDSSVSSNANAFTSEPFSMSLGISQALSELHLMDGFTTLVLLKPSGKSLNFSFLYGSSSGCILLGSISLFVDITSIGRRSHLCSLLDGLNYRSLLDRSGRGLLGLLL